MSKGGKCTIPDYLENNKTWEYDIPKYAIVSQTCN